MVIVIVIVILIAACAITTQRSLVNADEFCGNALSQIGVQQTSRWDALTNLANMTKEYSEYEYQTLIKIVKERKAISAGSSSSEVDQQEALISQISSKLVALAEAYPELKANEIYLSTMDSINDYENKVRVSRMSYNDTVTKFNRLVRAFPGCIFASLFGFAVRAYLVMDESKASAPTM